MTHKQYDYTYTRIGSFLGLRFDHRVLEMDPNTPLMERMKFWRPSLRSNLDEFL